MKSRILITGASGFIGTNLLQYYLDSGYDVINIDINPPQNCNHQKYWHNIDVNNFISLNNEIYKFNPDYVIHLAARTDLNGLNPEDYSANTLGVQNLVEALKKNENLQRVVFTSSQLVCYGHQPIDYNDYHTINLYGESKRLGELIVRNDPEIFFEWVIIRPTSIWGPWFREPYHKFFKMIINKTYFHLENNSCTKTYGYIENLIYQINSILFAPSIEVQSKIFYLGDYEPTKIYSWANEIASEIGIKIKTAPYYLIKLGAYIGDILKFFKISFPISSFRLKNMTSNNIVDLSNTKGIAPNLPYSRIEGIRKTLEWLKENK